MNIVDAIIIIIFILGILNGFKNGAIKSIISLVGLVIVLVLAFELKNPVAQILYNNLPFLDFGIFKGVAVFNILFYEIISFIIVYTLLMVFYRIILKVTGIFQKILDATVVLGLGSRILGIVIGFIETYIITFVVLFFFNQPFFDNSYFKKSKLNNFILNKSVILTNLVETNITAMNELFELKEIYQNTANINEYNYRTLDILLKYNIVTVESVKTLQSKNKLNFKNINELIIKYGG
ncbi:MAG: CvpA family protein [Bacilli bacterium]|nr:CvpA family protein [Bacilli bacterium]